MTELNRIINFVRNNHEWLLPILGIVLSLLIYRMVKIWNVRQSQKSGDHSQNIQVGHDILIDSTSSDIQDND